MANDDDFILGGRKNKKSSSSQGTPRTQNPRGGGNQSAIKLGSLSGGSMSFTKRLAKDMAIAKRSSGRKSYAKPSKPRTGRFNARGRGRTALAAGIGPNRSWQTFDGSSIRYRSRRAVVKVRVAGFQKGLLFPIERSERAMTIHLANPHIIYGYIIANRIVPNATV